MTKKEFLSKATEELASWCAEQDRSEIAWWLGLANYALNRYQDGIEAELRSL